MKSLMFIITITFVMLLVPTNVSAFIPENIPDTPNQIDWVIFFVTSRDECNSRNDDALAFYASLTDQYLSKFKTDHKVWAVECISKDIMAEVVNFTSKTYDLVIIIPDSLMSIQDRHTTNAKGHYANWNVHTIVSQAHTLSIEDRDTAWTLSHELAHFIVAWNDYSWDIVENSVHHIQGKYNDCYSSDTTLTHCSYLWETIKTPSGSYFPVMDSTYLSQVVESMLPKSTPPPTTNTPKTPSHSSDTINQLQTDYYDMKTELISKINSMIVSYQNLNFDSPLGNAKHGYVMNELRKINFESNDHNVNIHSQRWMDGRHEIGENGLREEIKELYGIANDLKQLDKDIIKAKSLESEFKAKQIQEKKQIPKSNEKTSSKNLNLSLYVIGNDGKKAKTITVSPQDGFSVEGYVYKNNVPEKYAKYTVLDNRGNVKDGVTNSNGFFRHEFTSEHSKLHVLDDDSGSTIIVKACILQNCEKATVYVRETDSNINSDNLKNEFLPDLDGDGIPDKDDKCPRIFGVKEKMGCKIPDSFSEKKYVKSEHEFSYDEVSEIQKESYEKLNFLKNDLETTRKSLEKLSSTSVDQKEKINQAWTLLKEGEENLNSLERRLGGGDNHVGYGNYDTAKNFFDNTLTHKEINENLVEISKITSQIQKSESKTCFLMWCW